MATAAQSGAGAAEGLARIRTAERERLSRRLHDRLGPLLCSAGLLTGMIRSAPAGSAPQGEDLIAKLERALEEAVEEVRLLSQEAAPGLASRRGLRGALELLARVHQAELRMEAGPASMPAPRADALCELARDALIVSPRPARIELADGALRIRTAPDLDPAVARALEASARAAGFGFTLQPAPDAATIEIPLGEIR